MNVALFYMRRGELYDRHIKLRMKKARKIGKISTHRQCSFRQREYVRGKPGKPVGFK